MGIGSTVSSILLNFRADTKQARSEIKKLSGEQKKAAQKAVDAQERQNAAMQKSIARIGKVALGIGAVVGAYKALSSAAREYAEREQKRVAAASANIEAIAAASRGLISETEALSFAAAQLNTDFKISQREMEQVAKFMVVLRNQGNDMKTVYREVTKALVEGNARGLRQFGIAIDGVSRGAEAHAAIMARIAEENKKAGDNILVAGDEALIAGNKWKNANDKLTDSLGRIGVALSPLVEMIASVTEDVMALTSAISRWTFTDLVRNDPNQRVELLAERERMAAEARRMERERVARFAEEHREDMARFLENNPRLARAIGGIAVATSEAIQEGARRANRLGRRRRKKGKGRAEEPPEDEFVDEFAELRDLPAIQMNKQLGGRFGGRQLLEATAAPSAVTGVGGFLSLESDQATKFAEAVTVAMDQVILSTEAAATAIGSFQTVGTAAFAAWITGSESLGKAIKRSIGETLTGLAIDMFSRSLFHAAMAVGQLAMLNPAGASLHATAAAKFGAGALAAGFAAKKLGGSGASASSAGAGAGPGFSSGALPPGAAGQAGTRERESVAQTFIVVNNPFDDDPRAARRRLVTAFDRANMERGSVTAVINA